MPERRIVVFDEGGLLSARVDEVFREYRFEVVKVRAMDRLVAVLEERPARLILIAVESPSRNGFSAFTRARMTCRRPPPILLTTRSLPPGEFAVHAKQRWRADGYLQIADMDDATFRRELGRWIRFGARRKAKPAVVGHATAAPPETTSRTEGEEAPPNGYCPDELAAGAQPAAAAGGPEASTEAYPPALGATASPGADAGPSHELRAALDQIERLSTELAQARRGVEPSPVSEPFHELQAQLGASEQRRLELEAELVEVRRALEQERTRSSAQLEALRRGHQLEISEIEKQFRERQQSEQAELEAEVQTLERLLEMTPGDRDPGRPPGPAQEPREPSSD